MPVAGADRIGNIACDRNREFDGILDLELTVAAVNAEFIEIAALSLHRRTGRLTGRRFVPMVHRHAMFLRRRAMRAVVILLERHGTGLQREIEPNGRKQAQNAASGPLSPADVNAWAQVIVSNTISRSIARLLCLGYWQYPLYVKDMARLFVQAIPGFDDDVLAGTVVRIATSIVVIQNSELVRMADF